MQLLKTNCLFFRVYGRTNHHIFFGKSTRKTLFWISRFFPSDQHWRHKLFLPTIFPTRYRFKNFIKIKNNYKENEILRNERDQKSVISFVLLCRRRVKIGFQRLRVFVFNCSTFVTPKKDVFDVISLLGDFGIVLLLSVSWLSFSMSLSLSWVTSASLPFTEAISSPSPSLSDEPSTLFSFKVFSLFR